jgi:hypothetical protein
VWDAVAVLRDVMANGAWCDERFQRPRKVT